jgi:N-methylhydantoinase B
MDEAALDPITLAVLAGRLEQIADEMDATLFRSAFNPTIAEARDASHGLYAADTGDTLVQGKAGLPIFVGVMAFAVRAVIAAAAEDPLVDGDLFLFNDPYDGGTHLSDFKLVRPYFRGGRLFCHLASVGHWHDVGGNVPGNYNPAATECFQEGMLIPPVRLDRAGVRQSDVLAIVTANSRLPQTAFGDLSGQIAALDLGVRRLDALLDQYGEATVAACFAALRERAGTTRPRISSITTAPRPRRCASPSMSPSRESGSRSTSRAARRPASARSTSPARPRSPASMSHSSTSSPTCRPMPACSPRSRW